MPPALLIGSSGAGACPACGGTCTGHPSVDHLSTYPFLPGGREPVPGVEGRDYVIATTAVHDAGLERNVYGAGDRVPMADAIKYGLVDEAPEPEPDDDTLSRRGRRARKGPDEDRAKHGPTEDR